MIKPKIETTVIDLITELRLVQGDLVRLGHPKGAMVVAQAVGSLAQYKVEVAGAKKALQSIVTGDAVVFDDDLQCDVEVAMDMDQAQALARHALAQF